MPLGFVVSLPTSSSPVNGQALPVETRVGHPQGGKRNPDPTTPTPPSRRLVHVKLLSAQLMNQCSQRFTLLSAQIGQGCPHAAGIMSDNSGTFLHNTDRIALAAVADR